MWWSPRPFVSFLLTVLSTLGFGAGVIDGLIGGLFMSSEIRVLKEFEWEIGNARTRAEERERDGLLVEGGEGGLAVEAKGEVEDRTEGRRSRERHGGFVADRGNEGMEHGNNINALQ